jgi:co-chaperonin GroES (HSP10)
MQHWQAAIDALDAHRATQRNDMQVKVGDIVVFSKNLYQEFKIDGETLIVMGEASIMGVLEQEVDHA